MNYQEKEITLAQAQAALPQHKEAYREQSLEWLSRRTGIPPAVFNFMLQESAEIVQITPQKEKTPARNEARFANKDTQLFEIRRPNGSLVSMTAMIVPLNERQGFFTLSLMGPNSDVLSVDFCAHPGTRDEIFITSLKREHDGDEHKFNLDSTDIDALEKMFAGFGVLPEGAGPNALPGQVGIMPAIKWGARNATGDDPDFDRMPS